MANETLKATSIVSKTGVQGTDGANITSLELDDTSYVLASNNNTSTNIRVGFDTPTGPLTAAATQTITVIARQFDEGQTGTPTVTLEVWEVGGGAAIASTTAANVLAGDNTYTISFTDEDTLDNTGTNLELIIVGTKSGGSPSTRNTVNLDFVKWDVDYTLGGVFQPVWALASKRSSLIGAI